MDPWLQLWLPTFNTSLVLVSGIAMLAGTFFIRRKMVAQHHASMIVAAAFAAAFLLVYVARALLLPTKMFAGEGTVRTFYLGLLASHVVFATVVGPVVLATLYLALRGRFSIHRRIARVAVPMWLYVVVSGWLVYLMLYHLT